MPSCSPTPASMRCRRSRGRASPFSRLACRAAVCNLTSPDPSTGLLRQEASRLWIKIARE
eukprot:4876568-Prymnesium_polylepis.1